MSSGHAHLAVDDDGAGDLVGPEAPEHLVGQPWAEQPEGLVLGVPDAIRSATSQSVWTRAGQRV